MPAFMNTRPTARPKINLLKSRRSATGCRAVRDSTLAAWYPYFYAPRAGGAYDGHHRTAGVAGCTRRHGGGVAVFGARAAADAAGDRFPKQRIACRVRADGGRVSSGFEGNRLYRG